MKKNESIGAETTLKKKKKTESKDIAGRFSRDERKKNFEYLKEKKYGYLLYVENSLGAKSTLRCDIFFSISRFG